MSQLEKVYGVHAVEALLRHHPKRVKQLWLAEGRHDPRVQVLLDLAGQHRIEVGQKDRHELDEWAEGVHQGVVAEVSPSQVWGENLLDELLERTLARPCCSPWMASPIRTTWAPACALPTLPACWR